MGIKLKYLAFVIFAMLISGCSTAQTDNSNQTNKNLNDMEISSIIKKRHSVRSYKPQAVESEKIDKILLAGCAAPVGMGLHKDMHITVVQSKELLSKITEAGKTAFKRDLIYAAPAFIIVSAKPNKQIPNIELSNAATVVENMLLQATELGLGSVYLLAIVSVIAQNPELCKELQIPEGFVPVAGMALGYSNEENPRERVLEMKINATKL